MNTSAAGLRRLINESTLFKNTLTLISGTVATQAIVFLFSPVLSRIFALVDFGYLANFNAWVAILTLLGNLRYEQAIIVANGRENTNRVVALTGSLSVFSCVVLALLAALIHTLYGGGGYLGDLKHVILFIPLGVFVVSVSSLFIQHNVKTGKFKLLAGVTAVQVLFTVVPQVLLGLMHVANALIIGTITGFLFSGIVFAKFFFQDHTVAEIIREVTPRRLLATATTHINFPRFMLGADVISIIVQQFIPVFVLALFSPAVAGLYAFSIRIVRVPMIVVSTAVTGALRKEAIDKVHVGASLSRLFVVTVRSLFLLSVVPLILILAFGPAIFSFVFGHQWVNAGRIAQILSPGILLEFVALPLTAFFLVTNTQRYTFVIQSLGFVLVVIALVCGKHFFADFIGTCYLVSGAMVLVNVLTILFARRVTGKGRQPTSVIAL
jgi:O-antigen/teichoic acid export membrane protein